MSWPRLHPVPYRADVSTYFDSIRHLNWPIWLDSGYPMLQTGRYDILVADPIEQIDLHPMGVDQLIDRLRQPLQPAIELPVNLPFCGGWVGYLSYELGRIWMGLASASDSGLTQLARIGLYDWALVVDHHQQTAVLAGMGRAQSTRNAWPALCQHMAQAGGKTMSDPVKPQTAAHLKLSTRYPDYAQQFEQIKHYIYTGDAYQVNLTQRFNTGMSADSWSLYQYLRSFSPTHYGAYLAFDDYQILSNSPEQFVSLQNSVVYTRPIKGTRRHGSTPQQDAQLRADLVSSTKDRAENLMIVDLLRNDLGKVCRPGSITTPALFTLESYATVHHLVSTVRGQLQADKDAVDLLQACFPGGSVTGAPKKRAMQIIDELEPVSRDVYCGSVFRLGFDGDLDSNINIRTLLKQGEALYYWSGGGIVADSECQAEYQESLDKAAAYFELIGITPHRQN